MKGPDPTSAPRRHERVCDDCGAYYPEDEECWRCAEVQEIVDNPDLAG